MKKLFSFLAVMLFAGSMMAAEVEIANATFNGKNATYTAGWTTTGTGVSRTDCVVIGKDENITSPSIDLSAYKSISITFKARRFGSLSGSKATISVAYGGAELGTIDVTASSVGDVPGSIDYNVPDGLAASSFVFTCTNATSAGSTHGAGIGTITITGNTGGESVAANFCKTEVGHLMGATPDPNSYVLLSIGSKGGKTIVRIDQDGEKNTQMFVYLQVTGLTQTGEDVAEGGAAAMAVEFDTPALTNDSMTLEILWSTVNWPGRWMVQNLRVAVADCQYATIPVTPITCAEVYSKAKDDKVALNDVTVTYVNGKNVYVKDESGAMLLYLPANATWKAGDKLAGIEGVVDIYNGLYEVKPSADQVAAVVATAGEAPAPVELAVAPVAADVNKYVILKNVSVAAGEFTTSSATNLNLTIGEATVVLRNNFKLAQVFDADAKYNIVAAVAIYNTSMQLYFISAEEIIVPALNIFAYDLKASEVADGKVTIDYKLNAKATAVEIQLLDAEGAVKKTFDAAGLKKGANQEVLDLADVDAGSYNWAVKATAKANEALVKVSDDSEKFILYAPKGVVVNNYPETEGFGTIYVAMPSNGQSDGSTTTSKTQKQGIFVWDALLNLKNTDNAGFKGDLTWQSDNVAAPHRLKVAENGDLYMGAGHAEVHNLYKVSADFSTFTPLLGHAPKVGGFEIVGNDVYALENIGYDAEQGCLGAMVKYELDKLPAAEAGETYAAASVMKTGNAATSLDSDGKGGFWICQNRSTDQAAMAIVTHLNANKEVDYNSASASLSLVNSTRGAMAVSPDKSLLAVCSGGSGAKKVIMFTIGWADGVPALTKLAETPVVGNNVDGIAFDFANNMYTVNSSKELLTIWALPKAENNCTTPAKKASKIVVAGTGTAIDNNFVPVKVQKIIVNGQVLIIKDGKTYNMMGQIVK